MPTYEYLCENCGYEFEHFQSISSEPLKKCPKCHHDSVVRKVSGGTGLIFNGSGFYITDYTNKKSSSAAPSGSATKKRKSSVTESKPKETKPTKSEG